MQANSSSWEQQQQQHPDQQPEENEAWQGASSTQSLHSGEGCSAPQGSESPWRQQKTARAKVGCALPIAIYQRAKIKELALELNQHRLAILQMHGRLLSKLTHCPTGLARQHDVPWMGSGGTAFPPPHPTTLTALLAVFLAVFLGSIKLLQLVGVNVHTSLLKWCLGFARSSPQHSLPPGSITTYEETHVGSSCFQYLETLCAPYGAFWCLGKQSAHTLIFHSSYLDTRQTTQHVFPVLVRLMYIKQGKAQFCSQIIYRGTVMKIISAY